MNSTSILPSPESLDTIIHTLQTIQLTRMFRLSAVCIVLYDYIITLDQEVSFLWSKRLSLVKLLYFLNRYYFVGTSIYAIYGLTFMVWQGWTSFVGTLLAQAILQVRLYALYSTSRKLLAFMLPCYVLSVLASLLIVQQAENQIKVEHAVIAIPIPGGNFCAVSKIPKYIYSFWIPTFAFDWLLCTLAIRRGYWYFKDFQSYGPQSRYITGVRMVDILVRDSGLYFIAMAMTYLACMVIWIVDLDLFDAPLGFSVAMSSTLCSRMILKVHTDCFETVVVEDFDCA